VYALEYSLGVCKKLTTSDKVDAYSFTLSLTSHPPLASRPLGGGGRGRSRRARSGADSDTVTSSRRRTIVSHRRLGGYQTTVWYHPMCAMLVYRPDQHRSQVVSIKRLPREPHTAHRCEMAACVTDSTLRRVYAAPNGQPGGCTSTTWYHPMCVVLVYRPDQHRSQVVSIKRLPRAPHRWRLV
jgi:hypothetical protein